MEQNRLISKIIETMEISNIYIKYFINNAYLRILITSILLIYFNFSQAQIQRTYKWYFGANAGIDFSSNVAVADTNGMVNTWDGCATISDESGNLLFYTDGSTVWNRNHQIMPTGTGLMGHWSSHQNSIIVPKPASKTLFYIFTTDAQENNFQNGLRYSIVDMALDNGFGDVTSKNILLMAPTHEQLGATFHSNCNDIWVITHKRDEEKFYAFLVTENGINPPVISEIGNATQLLWGCFGFKISPNGTKILSANFWDWYNTGIIDTVEIYEFNKNTGVLSNRKVLVGDTVNLMLSFSPDNNKIYVASGGISDGIRIYQYDVNAADINLSKQIVFETMENIFIYDAQHSPVSDELFLTNANSSYIPIIQNPNASGVACNFIDSAFYLNGKECMTSFPNFISSYFDTDSATNCFLTNIEAKEIPKSLIPVFPNPAFNTNYITIKTNGIKITHIGLYSLTGKEVMIKQEFSEGQIMLDISGIETGIYLLKLKDNDNNQIAVEKLVIQNK